MTKFGIEGGVMTDRAQIEIYGTTTAPLSQDARNWIKRIFLDEKLEGDVQFEEYPRTGK